MTKFGQGQKGNPGGRRRLPEELFIDLKKLTPKCVDAYRDALEKGDDDLKLKAAESLLSRLYGKPAQAVDLGGQEGNPINMIQFYIPDNGREGGEDGTSGKPDED